VARHDGLLLGRCSRPGLATSTSSTPPGASPRAKARTGRDDLGAKAGRGARWMIVQRRPRHPEPGSDDGTGCADMSCSSLGDPGPFGAAAASASATLFLLLASDGRQACCPRVSQNRHAAADTIANCGGRGQTSTAVKDFGHGVVRGAMTRSFDARTASWARCALIFAPAQSARTGSHESPVTSAAERNGQIHRSASVRTEKRTIGRQGRCLRTEAAGSSRCPFRAEADQPRATNGQRCRTH